MGPKLKRFYIEGAVKELEHLERKQTSEEARLKYRMLSSGCVPVLDITPLVGHAYDADKESFRYVITMYGVEVEGNAWDFEGWMNGELVPATSGTSFERIVRKSDVFSQGV